MKFQCQRTGQCCTHPQIVITLTHEDLWRLASHLGGLEPLFEMVQFMRVDTDLPEGNERLVLRPVKTVDGAGVFVLRKDDDSHCVFYDRNDQTCLIHPAKPQACQNFPFAVSRLEGRPVVTWASEATSFCPGIGAGKNWDEDVLRELGRTTVSAVERYEAVVDEVNHEWESGRPLTAQEALLTLYMVAEKENVQSLSI